jgi:hypothetical protein
MGLSMLTIRSFSWITPFLFSKPVGIDCMISCFTLLPAGAAGVHLFKTLFSYLAQEQLVYRCKLHTEQQNGSVKTIIHYLNHPK